MTELLEGWTTRRPTLEDIPALLALVHASDIASVGEPDFTAEEVREALTGPHTDMTRDCWVALDTAEQLVGWAYPFNHTGGERDFVEVYVWPGRGEPALRPLLDLMLGRVAERARDFGYDPMTVRAGAIATEKEWVATLEAAGFTFVKRHARMSIALDGNERVAPEPTAGVTVRPVRADDESEMRRFHATIEEAFEDTDHRATDFETWRAQVEAASSVAYDEWFVGEVDGQWAGVLQSSDQGAEDNGGWVKNLAVLGPYRRRGVGAALLRRAFATYAGKGRVEAGLGVDLANPTQAARLYHAVGMRPRYEADIYQRTVPAAA
ncbi:GNAT family N-acetyltransferase [Krasilnikovia sp. MM14-A1004]|uniref:GNAT family N-acetyltransferase n=1 Tax=Krasilnikovia sp. MM14-A1004 TaxID=3373541 RepID=UPI00399D28A7